MIHKIVLVLILLFISLQAQGPYCNVSHFDKIGEMIFTDYEQLHLQSEDINIVFFGNKTVVTITYDLDNRCDTTASIQCALPVTLKESSTLLKAQENPQLLNTILFASKVKQQQYRTQGIFRKLSLQLNSKEQEFIPKQETNTNTIHLNSEITLPKGNSSLTLHYEVINSYKDTQHTKSMIPGFSERSFHYDFETAKCWADKTVDSISLKVSVKDDAALFFNENYSLPRMLKKRNDFLGAPYRVMDFTMDQVVLANMAPIKLSADISPALKTAHLTNNRLQVPSDAILIRTSETQKEHTLVNLTDNDYSTGLELTGGRGKWIEISIDTSKLTKDITGIYLLNGNWRSENHYKANRRFKTARVEVAGATCEDSLDLQKYKINYTALDTLETDREFFGNKAVEIFSQKGSTIDKILKCKIIINDLIAGKKYNDLIISELIFTTDEY